jgi:hypothetical protein
MLSVSKGKNDGNTVIRRTFIGEIGSSTRRRGKAYWTAILAAQNAGQPCEEPPPGAQDFSLL